MSLIERITGSVINQLGGGKSTSSQSFGAIGKSSGGSGASFSLSKLSDTGAILFSRSALRINDAISFFSVTKNTLEKVVDIAEEMVKIAKQATLQSTTSTARSGLEYKFQQLLKKFGDVRKEAQKSDFDLLKKDDLREILRQAGVDDAKASRLVDAFLDIAGQTGLLGTDTVSKRQKVAYAQGFSQSSYSVSLPGGGDGTLTLPGDHDTGFSTTGVETEDVNGDGILDLINGTGANAVTVSIGNGDGSFLASVTYAGGLSASSSIKLADLNRDGALDMIVGSDNDGAMSILLGNSGGTFNAPSVFFSGNDTSARVEVGDVNGDGLLDVVAGGDLFQTVFIGNGDGAFDAGVEYSAGAGVTGSSLRDVNNDGVLDYAASLFDGNVIFMMGNANGSFKAAISFVGSTTFNAMSDAVLEDINRDGKIDLIASNADDEQYYIYLGNGDGNFRAAISIGTDSTKPYAIKVADVNGDGRMDLVGGGSGKAAVILGNGDGTFLAPVTTVIGGIGGSPTSIALGDLDRDGDLDIAISGGTTLGIGFNAGPGGGNGTFKAATSFSFGSSSSVLASGDFNNDGTIDYVTAGTNGYGYVMLGNGYGTFRNAVTYLLGTSPVAITLGDFNNDGKQDIAEIGSAGGVNILLGNGEGTFKAAISQLSMVGVGGLTIKTARLDADGDLDLVAADELGKLYTLQGNGDGTFKAAVTLDVDDPTAIASMDAIVRDVNGDGINDIIKITDTAIGSEGIVGVYLGNADGSFSLPTANYITGNSGQAIIGDFNRDGILDVATGTGSNNTGTSVLFGNSNGTFNAGVTYALDTTSDLKTADVNGDGILDLIGSSSAGQVRVALGNSNGSFAAPISYASLANTTEILVEDVNRDGRLDIAGISSDGKLVLLSGNGTGSFGATTTTVYEYTWGQVAKRAIGPEDPTDPTAKLTIKNRAEASLTVSVLDKILDRIRRDITGVDEILEELNGAFRFAQAGIVALQRTVSSGSATTPDGIAQSLIKQIRELTRDNAISAHSDIDSFLAKELLGS